MMMLTAIYTVVNSAQRSSSGVERRVIAQQDARGAMELMAMEIRMASYNPTLNSNIWVNPADCFSVAANQTYKGIQEATANSITIEMDVGGATADGDGAIGDDNEIIRYEYNATNQYITRETKRPGGCTPGGQPFLGDSIANEALNRSKTVLVVNDINRNGVYDAGVDIPVFRYYDGAGADISATVIGAPASLTTGIPAIRRVEITLVADTASVDQGSGVRKRIIYSTSVIPRNHIPVPTY
jgi:hypothetical protein